MKTVNRIQPKSRKTIQIDLIRKMKSELDSRLIGEHVIQSTIFNYLNEFEEEIIESADSSNDSISYHTWNLINQDYNLTKPIISKKLNKVISDNFKRQFILGEIEKVYQLKELGFTKNQ